jgi:(2Fe-2S) ferredoxin
MISGYSIAMNKEKIVTVCINRRVNPEMPSCGARGGVEIAEMLEVAIAEQGLPIRLERFKCLGLCERGPNIKLSPSGEFCHGVNLEDLPAILKRIAAFAKK